MRKLTFAACCIIGFGLTAGAMAAMLSDQAMIQNGHEYVCTGVGKHAQNDPRWDAYRLKLVFANRQGEYLSDISVSLMDANNAAVLEAHCDAPWLLVKLAPGRYKVRAATGTGHEKTIGIDLAGAEQIQIVVTFDQN